MAKVLVVIRYINWECEESCLLYEATTDDPETLRKYFFPVDGVEPEWKRIDPYTANPMTWVGKTVFLNFDVTMDD